MNSLTQIVLWCPVQVTVLAIAALGIGTVVGRRRPAAGAVVAAAALVAVVGVTATAFSPWPDWTIAWDRLPWGKTVATAATKPNAPTRPPAIPLAEQPVEVGEDDAQPIDGRATAVQASPESFIHRVWASCVGNWITIAVTLYLVGVGVMVLRIALGLRAVVGYRKHSHPITDRSLNELADVVCAELSCTRRIELLESTRLGTPATVGWLRPVLLLPAEWRRWTDEERHAVLAHEIEHVRRSDFAAWMAAQIGVALHFYHPLVHGLANRLRLQQELAADAAAARVLGGQRKYVTTLAAMALRQADERLAWPVSAFLPNSKTFLRRIDMLHRSKSLRGDVSRPAVILSVGAVLLAAVCAAGIRGSAAGEQIISSSKSTGENGASSGITVAFANQAEQQKAILDEQKANEAERKMRREVNNLKQIAVAMENYYDVMFDGRQSFPPAVVQRRNDKFPRSWRVEMLPFVGAANLYQQYRKDEPWDSENNKKVLEKMPDVFRSPFDDPKSTNSGYYVLVGPGTMFEGTAGIRWQDVPDGRSNTLLVVGAKRAIPWTKPEDIPFDPDKPLPELGGFVKGQFMATLADGEVHRIITIDVADQLKNLIIRNDHNVIDLQKLGPDLRRARGRIMPAPVANSDRSDPQFAVRAARARNQLKQLALAMHNYYDMHNHFPPAVVMGPDGKTPHSWRVEILQTLGPDGDLWKQNVALYKQYRLDEPWDSENNKKVLAQMPDTFRSPYDDRTSTNSAYYVLVGPGTVFEGPNGIKTADIVDGTSNTLMIVEAKRNIPWTKPEDLAFDPDKPLPELGGFVKGQFMAALADGEVLRFNTVDVADQLKNLIMRNDMQVISRDTFPGRR